jgi:hypothetical protein
VTDSTWKELQVQRANDPRLDHFLNQLVVDGRDTLDEAPLKYEKTGKRLLTVSRAAFQRIVLWSFDYRLTGDERFLQRAEQEMLAMAAFPNWNPSHFLDTAEMTAAMSLGYDWLYNNLSPASRAIIRQAIIEKGLRSGVNPKYIYWYHNENNWNQVCFGGMTLGALAVAEDDPTKEDSAKDNSLARQMLAQARANIHIGLKAYAPDGVYPEGPSYWSFGTTYQVLMIAALESALKSKPANDWNLSQSPGFLSSADYYLQITGPTRMQFNYSDGGAKSEHVLQPALFWLARKLNQPGLLYFQTAGLAAVEKTNALTNALKGIQFLPLAALWWPKNEPEAFGPPALPLDWQGQGRCPVAVMRSSWTNPDALYLAIKGGTASANHAHMDAGSFILEANGERWARDLGAQDYNSLESKGLDIWGLKQDSARWKVFRLNNFSHNTLTINGQLHNVQGFAPITEFSTDGPTAHAVVDLTTTFAGQASKVIREFDLTQGGDVRIEDTLEGLQPGDNVRWAMVTSAHVELQGTRAILRQDGKELEATETASSTVPFEVIPASPPNDGYDAPNPNTYILIINAKTPKSGRLGISVLLHQKDKAVN